MGIQINGNTNNINAGIGSLSIEDINELDIVGVATAANFKTGVSNLHSLGLTLSGGQLDVGSNIKIGTAGVVTATSFVGSLSGGSVSGTSGAFTGNIDLNSDINKLKIGAGDDFQFYHNGSNNFIETNNGDIRIKTSDSSGNLTFTAGGSTERARIDSSGRLLIGTTTQGTNGADALTVATTGSTGITIRSGTSNDGNLYFADGTSGNTTYRGFIQYEHSNDVFRFGTNSTEAFRIDSNGRMGLGTNSPSSFHANADNLVIRGDNAAVGMTLMTTNGGLDSTIAFADGTSGGAELQGAVIYQHNGDMMRFLVNQSERLHITSTGIVKITSGAFGQLNLRRSTSTDQEAIFYYGSSSLEIETREATSIKLKTNKSDRVKIQADGNVGIARTFNNQQTSNTNSLYNLSINRESSAGTYDGLNKSLNVDNQYTVQTFRSTNTNRSSTTGWMDVAHFRAWDINARVIIQAGGTFTGDQINIDVQSSYNSALNNGRSGPVLEVKRTEGHNGQRFTKVRIGCHNSNRQPILQVYFDGSKTHNSVGSVYVTVHDYGSNYGQGAHRGEAKFATATTLNETWEELDIDEANCDYFNTSTTPAFSAFKHDNSNQISSGVYAFNSQTLDRGGDNYNPSNGKFTAPCDGVYYFIATLQMYGDNGVGTHARFQKNGVDVYNQGTNSPTYDERAGAHHSLTLFALVQLSTDDYVECVRNNTTRGMQSAIAGFLVR